MASVLITGTSSGIGLATALVLSRAGHQVFAAVRDRARAARLVDAVAGEKLSVSIVTMDVNSDDSVRDAIDRIYGERGMIDVLVNNAGRETVGSVEESPIDRFRAVMETNYFGPLRCIKAILPGMRERRSGCIVNVTSIGGRIAMAACAAYTASKFALEALGEVLAQEVRGFNIRVAIVEPGIVDTAMAGRVAATPASSRYPQVGRMSAMVRASLAEPTPPGVVAEKIRDIIDSGTWQLRHPVGLDSQAFLDWRAAMSDEAWIELGALDDEGWRRRMHADWGMNLPPQT